MSPHAAESSLLDIIESIWAAKKLVLIGAIIGLISALIFISSAKPYYKATMIIAPASPMNSAQLSSLLANDNLFALRHLLQGNGNTGEFQSFEQIIHGQNMASTLLKNKTIRKGVAIDQKYGTFGLGTLRETETLSPAILSEYLAKTIKIQPVSTTSFRRLTYNHPSPEFAAYMLQELHKIADQKLRSKTNDGATTRIQYLKNAILETRNPEHRRALTTLLMEQERLKMLSSIDQPYAASIIEPAAASSKPQWPRKPLLFSLLTLCGAACGLIIHNLTAPQKQQALPKEKTRKSKKFGDWLKGGSNDDTYKNDEQTYHHAAK